MSKSPDYKDFLAAKALRVSESGFDISEQKLNQMLFPFQRAIVRWALKIGRAAIFADCGLGKTPMQLEWAHQVCEHTAGNVLILAPLAVSHQTQREADKFGITVNICKTQADVRPGINITNYEKLDHFLASEFAGVVLDESSILKSYSGSTRNQIIEMFAGTPYRLACTATPAPNDYMELGNHAEFLDVMSRVEMLSMFFVHDGGDTAKWRLKGHAESEFWKWLCTWSVMMRKPSDLGFSDDGFDLKELKINQHTIESSELMEGYLIPVEARTMDERRKARKASLGDRVQYCADLVKKTKGAWIIWVNLNSEGDSLESAIDGAVQVSGADDDDDKVSKMLGFTAGEHRVLITKPSIAGFGMNWQHCSNVAFVGLSDSYEQFYQAIRRCWRFGQKKTVNCHIITGSLEGAIVSNIKRKEKDATRMAGEMVEHMSVFNTENLRGTQHNTATYAQDVKQGNNWKAYLGDCVDVIRTFDDGSIDYSVFSPPFASLYTYSNSDRDMGNSKSRSEFFAHYEFLVREQFRTLRPGRLLSFHCMNLPMTKERDGHIGLTDFRGDLIRMYQEAGFIYHSEVVIWKDPVTAMQRTKALGLLHKQIKKDSARSRQGIPDYLVTMRKDGDNDKPITHTNESFPIPLWQRYASPVWMTAGGVDEEGFVIPSGEATMDDDSTINPSDTLQRESAREAKDERHIAPLQLKVIERAIKLWTLPGDVVFTPFLGIGSEAFVAVKLGRYGVGAELKRSYFEQAIRNLEIAEREKEQLTIFDVI